MKGFIVSQPSTMTLKRRALSMPAMLFAGVGNAAPKAVIAGRVSVQACPRRRSVGACDEPTDRRRGQPVFVALAVALWGLREAVMA